MPSTEESIKVIAKLALLTKQGLLDWSMKDNRKFSGWGNIPTLQSLTLAGGIARIDLTYSAIHRGNTFALHEQGSKLTYSTVAQQVSGAFRGGLQFHSFLSLTLYSSAGKELYTFPDTPALRDLHSTVLDKVRGVDTIFREILGEDE